MWSRYETFLESGDIALLTHDSSKILDMDPEAEEDGANQDLDSMRKGKCAVIKTSTRQVGLVYHLA